MKASVKTEREMRQEKTARRKHGPDTFHDFVKRHNAGTPNVLEYEHIPRLVDIGQRIIDKELKRVIVMMPRRHFKSEIFSRLLPAAYLHHHPTEMVGLHSYAANLAWQLSQDAKLNYEAGGGVITVDTKAKRRWRVVVDGEPRGEMWAEGVDSGLLGKGYHLGIIDDPQDPKQATSLLYQRRFAEWYPSKFYSGQEPDAAIVVIMQRLAPYDAINFLFEQESTAPEYWHVVCCDEIKSDEVLWRGTGPQGLPKTCTLEPDDRKTGEYLSPTRFGKDQVDAMHRADITTAKAQRQQRPTALTGDFWKVGWFDTYDKLPDDAHNGGTSWDTAYTKKDANAATAKVRSYRGISANGDAKAFPIYIEDVDWDWTEFDATIARIKADPGPANIEAKASGKDLQQHLKSQGINASLINVTGGDKLARSSGAQPVVASGRVKVNIRIFDKLLQGKHVDPRCNGRQGLLAVTAEMLATDSGDLDVNDAFVMEIDRHTISKGVAPSMSNLPI